MSDYADLIRRLDEFICGVPVRVSRTILTEAADAIEALVKERDAALRTSQQPNNEAIERVAIALCNLDPEHEWDTRTPMQKKLYRYKAREAIAAFLASRQEKRDE